MSRDLIGSTKLQKKGEIGFSRQFLIGESAEYFVTPFSQSIPPF